DPRGRRVGSPVACPRHARRSERVAPRRETLYPMRVIVVLALFLAACSNQPNAATSPTPTPSATSTTAAPSPTPTASSPPTPPPISLPSIAQISAPSATVVWALVGGTRLFRSSDRGDTWAERALPTGLAKIEVAFANDSSG